MEKLDIEVGIKLKELRNKTGLSMREVAKRVGMDHGYLSRIEKGNMPSLEKLKQLCAFYSVPISTLFGDEVETPSELKKLGVEWITHAENMKNKNLTPEQVEKMVEFIHSLKNL